MIKPLSTLLIGCLACCLFGSSLLAADKTIKQPFGPDDPAHWVLNQGPKTEAISARGMVSTQLASSTLAAVKVLNDGGNAVDAALTALFVQQVNDYHMVWLFGSMSALYYDAATNKVYALSAIAEAPQGHRIEHGDASRVSIGGTVRGAEALAQRFGSRPWKSYIEPAIQAAEEGAIVTSFMYALNFAVFEHGDLSDYRNHPEAKAFYMPEGHLVGVGRRWKMPALAATLRQVAEQGADYMYTGEWAGKFVAAAQKGGYGVTAADLAEYQPVWDEPVQFRYRGHTLYGSPPPDTGGLKIGFNLNVLENFDLKGMGHYTESAETLAILARSFDRVNREMDGVVRDPKTWRMPGDLWLSPEYGQMAARFVRETGPAIDMTPPSKAAVAATPVGPELGSDHIVVVDKDGNWLSMLHTIHGGAPNVFIDGVRAAGSAFPAGTVGPGRRLPLPISAIMVMKDGPENTQQPWLAMGTPGNPPMPVTEVLVNIIDFAMDPKEAVEQPRFWAFTGTDTINSETLGEDVVKGLTARGIKVNDIGPYNFHTGSMQIVWRGADGKLHGVTDPRRLGYAAGQ